MSCNTPRYIIDPSKIVTNDFPSFYNQKYAKKHNILQSRVFAYELICFLLISRKVKVLELRVVLSAYINMPIAVILSTK